ncbi:hypothetical protein [Mesorhizobium sp. L2C085B000]|uniref:hypothetical protein n=1 Tax=Mesorhizobium sp. L2C085B000 TaxID=1287117 RepID=UPI0012DF30D8|nr:hypothetical protein [Mesorhizobium sp. L2C085B000]
MAARRRTIAFARGQHSNRINGLLVTQGVRDFKPARRDWRERLEALGAAVFDLDLRNHLNHQHQRRHSRSISRLRQGGRFRPQAAEATAPETVQLCQLRGIGLISQAC